MKILHINTSDRVGGAAIAALRLLRAQRNQGLDAQLLCRDRSLPLSQTEVMNLKRTPFVRSTKALDRLSILLHNGCSTHNLWRIDTAQVGNDITRLKAFREADVIHMHWVNQGMLSLSNIAKIITSGKRVVWTLHDMWPFTSLCHQAAACQRWRAEGCGHCPLLKHPRANDLSAKVYAQKAKVYAKGHFTAVGCSHWLADLAAESPLFKGQQVVSIANALDTQKYAPAGTLGYPNQTQARQQLGLPAQRRMLLFMARDVADPNKGIDYLLAAVKQIAQQAPDWAQQLLVVMVGLNSERYAAALPPVVQTKSIAYVESDNQLRLLYQAADMLVMPTLMDNLPNTIAEASACGLPTVAFGVGGVPQMVETGVNGYLAQPASVDDLTRGIISCLTTNSLLSMQRNARVRAVNNYSEKAVVEAYLKIYQG